MDHIKSNVPNYVIDKKTKAVINTDQQAYDRVISERQRLKHMARLEAEIKSLREEVNQIKKLLDVNTSS